MSLVSKKISEQINQFIKEEGEDGYEKLISMHSPTTTDIKNPNFSLQKFYAVDSQQAPPSNPQTDEQPANLLTMESDLDSTLEFTTDAELMQSRGDQFGYGNPQLEFQIWIYRNGKLNQINHQANNQQYYSAVMGIDESGLPMYQQTVD